MMMMPFDAFDTDDNELMPGKHPKPKGTKTFVLRCDKPRYDGGVELDLEHYFGQKLNRRPQRHSLPPSLSALDYAALETALKKERLAQHTEAVRALHQELKPNSHSNTPQSGWPSLNVKQPAVTEGNVSLLAVISQGPLQIAVSLLGFVTTALAMLSLCVGMGQGQSTLRQQSRQLLNHCVGMLGKGVLNTLLMPQRACELLLCKAMVAA
jgi:hypothetical protein